MVKKKYRFTLSEEQYKKFEAMAKEEGYSGKGFRSHYLQKIIDTPFIFVNSELLKAMKKN